MYTPKMDISHGTEKAAKPKDMTMTVKGGKTISGRKIMKNEYKTGQKTYKTGPFVGSAVPLRERILTLSLFPSVYGNVYL